MLRILEDLFRVRGGVVYISHAGIVNPGDVDDESTDQYLFLAKWSARTVWDYYRTKALAMKNLSHSRTGVACCNIWYRRRTGVNIARVNDIGCDMSRVNDICRVHLHCSRFRR